MSNPGEVIIHVGGSVDPALLAGLGKLDERLAAAGASSEDAAAKAQHAARATNESLRGLRDSGNQGFQELSQKAGEFARELGGAAGMAAEVGVKSLAAFGPIGMGITAAIGLAGILFHAHQESQAALQRQVVTAGAIKAATEELGGAYASVAHAADSARTADEARLQIARQMQAVTALQLSVMGAGFSTSEARALTTAYEEVARASQQYNQAQVEHAIVAGSVAEQQRVLGVQIERSSNAEVEHENVLRRAAAAREIAMRGEAESAEAALRAARNISSATMTSTERYHAQQVALDRVTTARRALATATEEATRQERESTAAIEAALEAERERAAFEGQTAVKSKGITDATSAATGPTAAQRAQSRLTSQAGARTMAESLDHDLIERRIADLDRLTGTQELAASSAEDRGQAEVDRLLAQASMADQLADKERARLNAQQEAHESFTGRLRELYGEQASAAGLAADSTQKAFGAAGKAIGDHILAVTAGTETVGAALHNMLTDVLNSIAQEAAAKGAMEFAAGLGALAGVATAGLAPGHFAASAAYFGVAAVAGVAATASLGAASTPAPSGGSGGGVMRDPPPSSDGGAPETTIIHYHAPVIGGRESTDAEIGERLRRFERAAGGRGPSR